MLPLQERKGRGEILFNENIFSRVDRFKCLWNDLYPHRSSLLHLERQRRKHFHREELFVETISDLPKMINTRGRGEGKTELQYPAPIMIFSVTNWNRIGNTFRTRFFNDRETFRNFSRIDRRMPLFVCRGMKRTVFTGDSARSTVRMIVMLLQLFGFFITERRDV